MKIPRPVQVGEPEYVEFTYENWEGRRFGAMEILCERPQDGAPDRWRAVYRYPKGRRCQVIVYAEDRETVVRLMTVRMARR